VAFQKLTKLDGRSLDELAEYRQSIDEEIASLKEEKRRVQEASDVQIASEAFARVTSTLPEGVVKAALAQHVRDVGKIDAGEMGGIG
jgi:hypothetical protein